MENKIFEVEENIIPVAIDENGYATATGMMQVYCVDENGVYIGEQEVQVIFGCGLPAGAYLDAPTIEAKENEAIIRDGDKWAISPDFRKQIFYSTKTGESVEIKNLGDVPENLISIPKPEGFYKWSGVDWVEDTEAKKAFTLQKNTAERDVLALLTEEEIVILERKVKLKRATEAEKALLDKLYNYSIDLSELDLTQENIVWPVKPESPNI